MNASDSTITTGLVIIEAVVLSIYNQPAAFTKAVYGLSMARGSYFEEKMARMINNFGAWWGDLDSTHRRRAITAAMDSYGNEATRRVENYS